MEPLSIAGAVIGLLSAVQAVAFQMKSVDDIPDITKNLERIALLLHLHGELLAKVSEEERGVLFRDQLQAVECTHRALQQVQGKLLSKGKWFERIISMPKSPWQRDRARVNEQLQQSIRLLELTLVQQPVSTDLENGAPVQPSRLTDEALDLSTQIRDTVPIRNVHGERRKQILNWLTPVDCELKRWDLARDRVPKTGEWLLKTEQYRRWRDGARRSDNLLWCKGKPGSGKSMLTSFLIDHLQDETGTGAGRSSNTAIVYYFFDIRTQTTVYNAVTSLLRQICYHRVPLPSYLTMRWDERESSGENSRHPTLSEVVSDFLSLIPLFSNVFILIDGLDECQNLADLVSPLHRLASSTCRLFLASRPALRELPMLQDASNLNISVDSMNQPDLTLYLQSYRKRRPELMKIMSTESVPSIFDQLIQVSKGSFLFATYQMSELAMETTPGQLKRRVESLPRSLEDAYRLLIQRLANQAPRRADLAMNVLTWVAYAERRLTLPELQQAVSIEPFVESGNFNPDAAFNPDNLSPPELIEEVCFGLITVDVNRKTVLASHASLVYYLRQFRDSLFVKGDDYVARCVLSFLCNSQLRGGVADGKISYQQRKQALPLLDYVSKHWGYHVKHLSSEIKPKVFGILDTDLRRAALSQALYASESSQDYPRNFSWLHFAAYFNLSEMLLESNPDSLGHVNDCDSWGRTPLHIACQRAPVEHRDVGRHEDPELGGFGATSINFAPASAKHREPQHKHSRHTTKAWEFFLTRSIARVERDGDGRTALHYATLRGSTTAAKAVADQMRMDDVSIRDKNGRTALDYAAESGNLELVEHLLERSSQGPDDALWLAASNGHKDVISFLLNHGYDSLEDRALFEACKHGHRDVAVILLDRGANATYRDAGGMTALHQASFAGYLEITRLLIQEGADINTPDEQGRSPLCLAAEAGNAAIIKLFVQMGAYIDSIDDSGRTALDQAAENGHSEALRYLIHHGARTNSSGFSDSRTGRDSRPPREMSPLQISCKLGFEPNVAVLLDEDAGPDKTAGLRRTPLSLACEGGHDGIVKRLLDTGRVNVNAEDDNGRTPLSFAAQRGHAEVVKLLLAEPRISLEARDRGGRTALSYAAEAGPKPATLLLLQSLHTAALSVMDGEGKSPVDYAKKHGAFQCVLQTMVENGDGAAVLVDDNAAGGPSRHTSFHLPSVASPNLDFALLNSLPSKKGRP